MGRWRQEGAAPESPAPEERALSAADLSSEPAAGDVQPLRKCRWHHQRSGSSAAELATVCVGADDTTAAVEADSKDLHNNLRSDPIQVLLASSLESIIPAPRDGHARGSYDRGGSSRAASAAREGLFPRSHLVSPWQMMLEDGLARDCEQAVLGGGAYHLRAAFCSAGDLNLFEALHQELGRGEGAWSRGSTGKAARKWSLPGLNGQGLPASGEVLRDLEGRGLPACTSVLRGLCDRFQAECLVWWMNLYEDGRAGRSFHHDCSAGDRGRNMTIGASFGAMRSLTFRHANDRRRSFDFPQWNGDVFAFHESVNSTFEHGIYPLRSGEPEVGPRISVIVMAKAPERHLSGNV